jgi:carbamoyltransferase
VGSFAVFRVLARDYGFCPVTGSVAPPQHMLDEIDEVSPVRLSRRGGAVTWDASLSSPNQEAVRLLLTQFREYMTKKARIGPRHPLLAAAAFRATLPVAQFLFRRKHIHRSTGIFAGNSLKKVAATVARGEPAYLAGISIGGIHNSGVALVEVTREGGPKIICNNEDERFSGQKHTSQYPRHSLEALTDIMKRLGIGGERVLAWLTTFDYPLLVASRFRTVFEEFPASLELLAPHYNPAFNRAHFNEGLHTSARLSQLFGFDSPIPLIGMPHHDNHALFSYWASPFAQHTNVPVMIAVIDGSGDFAAITLYVGESGAIRKVRSNASLSDSLGDFYGIISSTQGGWTLLSSEGRYMGASAYGDMNRSTNQFYPQLRSILSLQPDGHVYLNRSLADWPRHWFRKPYTRELVLFLAHQLVRAKCGIRTRYFVSKTSITHRIHRNGSIKRRPPRWSSRTRSFTSSTI